MKSKIRTACDLILGLSFIISVILGYYTDISYMSEYCFLSGLLAGILLLISFFYGLRTGKTLSGWLYFAGMVNIFVIFIATVSMQLNLEGAFWVIHIINPLLLFLYWAAFCNHAKIGKFWGILSAIIFPLVYILFAYILYRATESCPFPAKLLLVGSTFTQIVLGILILVAALLALGAILHFLNALIHRKLLKD